MANRSYLYCDGGSADVYLVTSYSLPDGWLDLFGPGDLYEGRECPLPARTQEHTLSYLLCEAPVALDRFRSRMARAKISLVGESTHAKLWRFFEEHFSRGHLFADTTELQWMREDTFVADVRRGLTAAENLTDRVALTSRNLLWEFGWGSGLSDEEIARQRAYARPTPRN